MATKIFPTNTASDINPGAELEKYASFTQGSAAVTKVTNTVLAGTAVQCTDTAGGTVLAWFTDPLEAVTISGNVTINIRCFESSMTANASSGVKIERTNGAGTVQSTLIDMSFGVEMGTTEGAQNAAVAPTSTNLSSGDRLKITIQFGGGGGVMASGFTMSTVINGAAGATGDTWLQFTETIAPYVPKIPNKIFSTIQSVNRASTY